MEKVNVGPFLTFPAGTLEFERVEKEGPGCFVYHLIYRPADFACLQERIENGDCEE